MEQQRTPPMNVFLAPIIEEVNKLYTVCTTCMHMLLTMCIHLAISDVNLFSGLVTFVAVIVAVIVRL